MSSKGAPTGDLVLASGVAYFNENFNALPYVVDALTTRASTVEALRSDAAAVDRTLARLLDKGADTLLQSTSLLTNVSSEFEESRAQVRDLKRRVGASLASLSGRKRDLNGLSFRQQQAEHALRILESVETCLRACQGPLQLPIRPHADGLKRALFVFKNSLQGKAPPDILAIVKARLDERQLAVCKLLRSQLLDSVSARGPEDADIAATLGELKDFGALDETLVDASRTDLKLNPPARESRFPHQKTLRLIICDFLSFPNMESIENVLAYTEVLIQWGDLLMHRASQLTFGLKVLGKPSNFTEETWSFVQDQVERALGPLLDAFSTSNSSTAATQTTSVKSDGVFRPKHYSRRKGASVVKDIDGVKSDHDVKSASLVTHQRDKIESSPYHLAFVSKPLLEFVRRQDPREIGKLAKFLRSACENSLRSVVNRDSASLFELSPTSRVPDFTRVALRLTRVVDELKSRVLDHVEICSPRMLLMDVCIPFVHACRTRIDSAADRLASAWIASGGAKLAQFLKSDPLFLVMEAIRAGNDVAERRMLLDASLDHLRQHQSSGVAQAKEEEWFSTRSLGEDVLPHSDAAILVGLSACLQRVASLVPGEKEHKDEITSAADFALFVTRADLGLRVDASLKAFAQEKIDFEECVRRIAESVRETRTAVEEWVEMKAVLDFVFFPSAFRVCRFLSRVLSNASKRDLVKQMDQDRLFALHSAFCCGLVDASDDPWSDLNMFSVVQHALRVVQTWPDNMSLQRTYVSDAEAKDYHRQLVVDSGVWQYFFSQEEILNLGS